MSGGSHMSGRVALVVERDEGQRALGAALLSELDLSVEQVGTAEEAIERLCGQPGEIGVVLAGADLRGGMDGRALAHRVAVLWPTVSVIVTSADSNLDAEAPTSTPKPWGRPLDIVAAAEKAARADHSVRAVRL